MSVRIATWPKTPYKGLSVYGPDDIPLFASRDDDVYRCAEVLGLSTTRVLILHGSTGCGKSSFLRAGLIPFLEGEGFFFRKEKAIENKPKALFVRSTDVPLMTLAEELFRFIEADFVLQRPVGPKTLSLAAAKLGFDTREAFLGNVGTEPDLMVKSLEKIAEILPRTLVLVIDQGEEVLTLKPGPEGDVYRDQFFGLIKGFSRVAFDLKLLIALRTEYYGRFEDEVLSRGASAAQVRYYRLRDLSREGIIAAIERPTSTAEIPGYGVPRDHYKFRFAKGVPERIADNLMKRTVPGGRLPVLQIVCERLYNKTRHDGHGAEWEITESEYASLGGVEGQIRAYFTDVLAEWASQNGLKEWQIEKEIERWRDLLCELTVSQADGTATAVLRREQELLDQASALAIKLDFKATMDYLEHDERRIVRRVDVVDVASGQRVNCYSLAHEALALFLRHWKSVRQEARNEAESRTRAIERFLLWFGILVTGTAAVFTVVWVTSGYADPALKTLTIVSALYGLIALAESWLIKRFGLDPRIFLVLHIFLENYLRLLKRILTRLEWFLGQRAKKS